MSERRLIDANNLEKEVSALMGGGFWGLTEEGHAIYDAAIESAIFRIREADTIDAEPVRHGRWVPVTCENHPKIILGCTGYMCSECGRIEEENSEPHCHCGAKMDAKEDAHT